MCYSTLVEILFEDSKIIAVNKPSGIPSHSLQNETSVEKILNTSQRAILLHRLDTGTSGVLLFAKNEAVFEQMREKFKTRSIEKFYTAWSAAHAHQLAVLTKMQFPTELTLPLAHHPKSKKRMIVVPTDKKISFRGKPLAAHTRILAIQPVTWAEQPALEIQVQIITGVMHQIRVHLKHLGFPLIGDPIYTDPESKIPTEGEPPHRLGLHAKKIRFELDGYLYQIEAPAP